MSKFLEPSFFIIGERKCASSSLYRYLIEHPGILPCKIKEPQFFSKPAWYRMLFFSRYRKLFPRRDSSQPATITWYVLRDGKTIPTTLAFERQPGISYITGEASANYFSQADPMGIRYRYPHAKILLCLRNPVDRAHSHYRMLVRFYNEGRKLPFVPEGFHQDVLREIDAVRDGGKSYFVAQGIYLPGLQKWERVFPPDRIFLVRTENLLSEKQASGVMKDIIQFLGLDEFDFSNIMKQKFNVGEPAAMEAKTRKLLEEFYSPHVTALEQHLGYNMHWF